MNNLTVDNASANGLQRMKHRKSIIGKLERSSFQAQRLSDVGIAFSQQITAKVGLKLPASQERIVEQTRWLYLRYVFVKLRQNRLPLRDLNLTKSSRARRAAALGCSNEAQIVVSISEPPSADALTLSDQRPLFTPIPSPNMSQQRLSHQFGRKRSALTTNVDLHDLSLLAARLSNTNNNNSGHDSQKNKPRNILRHQPDCIDEGSPHQLARNSEELTTTSNSNDLSPSSFGARFASAAVRRLSSSIISPLLFETKISSKEESLNNAGHQKSFIPSNNIQLSASQQHAVIQQQSQPTNKRYLMDPTINNQIFSVIISMINELRDSKPEFYGDTIYEVIGLDKFGSLESLLEVQKTICQEMTRTEISWERIVALFSLFGAMSLDCVRLGAPEHVGPILDGFIGFVERDLAFWISQQGGWESYLYKFRAGYRYGSLYKLTVLSMPLLLCWAIISFASTHR